MRQIVVDQCTEEVLRGREVAAVTDPRLYNEICEKHYIQPFEEFCRLHGFGRLLEPIQGPDPGFLRYVKQQTLRRGALKQFLLEMQPIVMHENRCFMITVLTLWSADLEIEELTIEDLADGLNEAIAEYRSPRSQLARLIERLRDRYRKLSLRRKVKAARF